MRLLLDTHALLWALSAPARLPARVAAAIREPSNAVYVSAATGWEIAIKVALGKLSADMGEIASAVEDVGFEELVVRFAHARRLRTLAPLHRDPFDRMLVAQALEEGLTIVTRDRQVAAYGVPTIWA